MNVNIIETVILIIARIFGICLITYYFGMQALVFVLIGKSLLVRFIKFFGKKRVARKVTKNERTTLKYLFERSLFFNHTLVILTIIFIAFVISQIPDISTLTKIEIFTVFISILPYVFSFTRATNVGLNGGIIGTIAGLILFSYLDPSINWWEKAAYFLIITGLANISGWVGGWVGPGQLREAVSATIFKVKMDREGATLNSLVETIRKAINEIIPASTKERLFSDQKPNMIIAQGDDSFSIVSYRHELEWRQVIRPQAIALKWLFNSYEYPTNLIIDYVFNLFRAKVTKVILASRQPITQGNSTSSGAIYLIVLNYKETPSIVWVDDDVIKQSHAVCEQVRNAIINEDIQNIDIDWKISKPIETVVRQWHSKVTLEQYSKDTIGANMPYEVIKEGKIDQGNKIPLEVMDEIIKTPTVYDKFRGQAFAFVSFMFFQVFIGILINVLSARMDH